MRIRIIKGVFRVDIIAIDYGWSEARENWHFGTLSSYPGAKWCGKAVFFEILVDPQL